MNRTSGQLPVSHARPGVVAARVPALRTLRAKLLRSIPPESFVRSSLTLVGGTVLAQGLTVLLSPVVTRVYSPAALGGFALFTSVVGIASIAVSLRYETAIVSATDSRTAAHLVLLAALLLLPSSLLFTGVVCLLSRTDILSLPFGTSLSVFPALVLLGGFNIGKFWMLRARHFRDVAYSTMAQSVGRMATQIPLGIAGFAAGGLVAGDLVGRSFGMTRMMRHSIGPVRSAAHPVAPIDLKRVAILYRKFPIYSLPSSLINSLSILLPAPLFALFYGIAAAGQFSLAIMVISAPLIFVGNSLGDAFHERIAAYARTRPEATKRFFLRVALGLFAIGLPPIVTLALIGKPLFTTVFGSEWEAAGVLAAALTPWALSQFVVAPLSRIVLVYQGQELKLIYDVFSLAVVVLVPAYADMHQLSFATCVRILAVCQAATYVVYFILLYATMHRTLPTGGQHEA